MHRLRESTVALALGMAALAGAGCAAEDGGTARKGGQGTSVQAGLRYEIDISERRLYEYIDDELINTYPVAVGQPEYPTPTGRFRIHQVDWNPDWEPPETEWAAGEPYRPPGHPENPMGRARLIFNPPYTIHGTDALESLGQAESHGSVRVANEVAMNLARRVMQHGGASRSEEWYQEAMANPTEMRQVTIPNRIPLTIRE